MKSEEWIIGIGVAVLLGIAVITIFAEGLWEDEYHDAPAIAAGTFPPHRDGREKIACASCHVVLAQGTPHTGSPNATGPLPPPPILPNAPAPHVDGREKMACKNCHVILKP
ncbi:magnetochrome domain-containing protein [Magnetovibrio blakemorei]|uniref:MamX protein n=2 Tax=Pseudomonadota TaxID=1224 RepID=C4RAD0_9PROT|nr:magnetochrome domain-containing protein [Magnetovibrio blakemorei]ASN76817.1 MamX [Vibrio sp. MV-1]OEJ64952.1 hypothetical protein BEN30_00395 [Magnetovibrio blakemorei]CAV30775.1 MamX protein [Magnetovibrio blakemorei]